MDDRYFGVNVPLWDDWVARDTPADWKRAAFVADLDRVRVAVLHVSGLWEVESIATDANWSALAHLGHQNQFARNLNTGEHYAEAIRIRKAIQTIRLGRANPSALTVSILPDGP